MTYSSSDCGYKPFEEHKNKLKKLVRNNRFNKDKKYTQKYETQDEVSFLSAMENVVPLKGKKRVRPASPEIDIENLSFNDFNADNQEKEIMVKLDNLIKSGKGFHVCRTPEYQEMICAGVPDYIAAKLHNGKFSIQDYIDLHGLCAADAEEEVLSFLKRNFEIGKNAVLIVHGRGLSSPEEPVLKKKVHKILSSNYWRRRIYAFTSARGNDGGAGGTYVLFRKRALSGKEEKNLFKNRVLRN